MQSPSLDLYRDPLIPRKRPLSISAYAHVLARHCCTLQGRPDGGPPPPADFNPASFSAGLGS